MPFKSRPFVRLVQPILMGKWANVAFTDQFCQAMSEVPGATLSKRLVEALKVDVVDALSLIDVKTLYLRATNDRLIPARMSQDFLSASVHVKEISGPHFLLQARPEEAATEIDYFVAGL